jgi:hypothetical protein
VKKIFTYLAGALGLFGSCLFVLANEPSLTWHVRNPQFPGQSIHCIAYGDGRYVAAGADGMAFLSGNGTQWIQVETPVFSTLFGITFGGGSFVAVGDFGAIVVSTNGIDWQEATTLTFNTFRAVAYAKGIWVAVGDNMEISVSTNTLLWQKVIAGSSALTTVTYAFDQFIAAGEGGMILTSRDGRTWTRRPSETDDDLGSLVLTENGILAWPLQYAPFHEYPYSATLSTNATVWKRLPINAVGLVAHDSGKFINLTGPSHNQLLVSTNPSTWQPVGFFPQRLLAVAALSSQFYIVGEDGLIARSASGSNWLTTTTSSGDYLLSVAYGSERFIAIAIENNTRSFLTSLDGVAWSRVSSGTAPNQLYAVCWGADRFIAVGGYMSATSTDGLNWNVIAQPSFNWDDSTRLAYGNGRFVAVQYPGIQTSIDGISWTAVSGSPNSFDDVAFSGSVFIAVGASGRILSSTDAQSWNAEDFPFSAYLTHVAYGNGRFVTWSDPDVAFTSDDGHSWTSNRTELVPHSVASRLVFLSGR